MAPDCRLARLRNVNLPTLDGAGHIGFDRWEPRGSVHNENTGRRGGLRIGPYRNRPCSVALCRLAKPGDQGHLAGADRRSAYRQGGWVCAFGRTQRLSGSARHVLDLADELELTPDQRQATERLFARMQAQAIPHGEALLEGERALEVLFREGRAEDRAIATLTAEIGALEARLRATHLKYHVDMAKLLSAHQRVAYDRLRGYDAAPSGDHVSPAGQHGHGG